MATTFDQNITYRVNVDDSNFQAKLSQMRASMDMAIGGMGGGGLSTYSAFMAPRGSYGGQVGGISPYGMGIGAGGSLADFGAQITPVTYTPPAIAMQPHFGMIAIQQSTPQAFAGSMGLAGAAAYNFSGIGAATAGGAFVGGVLGGPVGMLGGAAFGAAASTARFVASGGMNRDLIPQEMTVKDYSQLSARTLGTRVGDAAATTALFAGTTGASIGAGLIAGAAGAGLLGSLAVTLPIDYVGTKVFERMTDNRAMQSALEAGSFRFVSGGKDVDPYTGRGFSRAARADVAKAVQGMEVSDIRYGMDEYKQILEGGMQMNLFSGAGDAESFKTKFKGLVDTLKTVTSVLHTSLQEGMQAIRGFQDMGITSPGDISAAAFRADAMGRAAGRTGMEMLAIGQTGAEMFRGTGVRMGLGAELNQMNTVMIRSLMNQTDANGNPLLSRETVAQAGGELEMAKQATANALAFTQTAFGRGVLMAATRGGAAADPGSIAGGTAMSLMGRAAGMSAGQIFHFEANQEEIIGKMSAMGLQGFAIGGYMAQARTLAGAGMGIDFKDAFIALQKRNGVGIEDIHRQIAMLESDPSKLTKDMEDNAARAVAAKGLEDYRNTVGLKAISNAFTKTFVEGPKNALMDLSASVGESVDRAADYVTGGNTTATNKLLTQERVQRGRDLVEGKTIDQMGAMTGTYVIDASGNYFQNKFGGATGKTLADAILSNKANEQGVIEYEGLSARTFKSVDDLQKFAAEQGKVYTILSTSAKGPGGSVLAVPTSQLDAKQEQERKTAPTEKERNNANSGTLDKRLTDKQKIAVESFIDSGGNGGADDLARALYGDDFDFKKASETGSGREQIAFLERVASSRGLKSVETDLKGRSLGGSNASVASASALVEEANKAADKVKTLLWKGVRRGRSDPLRLDAMSGSQQEALLTFVTSNEGADPNSYKVAKSNLRDRLAESFDQSTADEIIKSASGIKDLGLKDELLKQTQILSAQGGMASVVKNKAQGTTDSKLQSKDLNGPIAAVSQETLTQMEKMVSNIKSEMAMINDLVKKWQSATGLH